VHREKKAGFWGGERSVAELFWKGAAICNESFREKKKNPLQAFLLRGGERWDGRERLIVLRKKRFGRAARKRREPRKGRRHIVKSLLTPAAIRRQFVLKGMAGFGIGRKRTAKCNAAKLQQRGLRIVEFVGMGEEGFGYLGAESGAEGGAAKIEGMCESAKESFGAKKEGEIFAMRSTRGQK